MRIIEGQTPILVERQIRSPRFSFKYLFPWTWLRLLRRKRYSREVRETDLEVLSKAQEISPNGSYLVDAFICEPIPYRTAINDNCTHVGMTFSFNQSHLHSCVAYSPWSLYSQRLTRTTISGFKPSLNDLMMFHSKLLGTSLLVIMRQEFGNLLKHEFLG